MNQTIQKKRFWFLLQVVLSVTVASFANAAIENPPSITPSNVGAGEINSIFSQANAALNRGEVSEAVRLWLPLAEQGNAPSQYNIALLYSRGEGIGQDLNKAGEWALRAANQGLLPAQAMVAVLSLNPRLTGIVDKTTAFDYARNAALANITQAQLALGLMYLNGIGTDIDKDWGSHWLQRAAEANSLAAQVQLSKFYSERRDYARVFEWTTKAANQGWTASESDLGWLYRMGHGTPQNDQKAIEWYAKAANKGDVNAMIGLGAVFGQKQSFYRNPKLAAIFLGLATKAGGDVVKDYSIVLSSLSSKDAKSVQKIVDNWSIKKPLPLDMTKLISKSSANP